MTTRTGDATVERRLLANQAAMRKAHPGATEWELMSGGPRSTEAKAAAARIAARDPLSQDMAALLVG